MKAFTLHGVDDELYQRLVAEAENRGWSINLTAKIKLKEAFGLEGRNKNKRDLSWLKGKISKEDWDRAERRIGAAFEVIDEEEWK